VLQACTIHIGSASSGKRCTNTSYFLIW